MTATGHAIIGAVIAAKVGNPEIAIPLALLSHIAADMFPHWDTATNIAKKGKKRVFNETVVDVLFGYIFCFFLLTWFFPQTNLIYAFVIIIVSQLFDWLTAFYYFFGVAQFKFFYRFQKSFDNPQDKPWGIINQVAALVILIVLAIRF